MRGKVSRGKATSGTVVWQAHASPHRPTGPQNCWLSVLLRLPESCLEVDQILTKLGWNLGNNTG
jgi:hypothetical protein